MPPLNPVSLTIRAGQLSGSDISLQDAQAYCQWLTAQDSKHIYRLPSEEEWILGAGHMPKDVAMNANHVESGLTAVDAYKQSTAPAEGLTFGVTAGSGPLQRTPTGQ